MIRSEQDIAVDFGFGSNTNGLPSEVLNTVGGGVGGGGAPIPPNNPYVPPVGEPAPYPIKTPIAKPITEDGMLPPPIEERNPPALPLIEKESPPVPNNLPVGRISEKTDVTIYGYYRQINKVTINVDNDLGNTVVVPNTTFPYIVKFSNYNNSIGKRYMSEYTYINLIGSFETNLGKIISDLDNENGNFSYVTLDWKKFDTEIIKTMAVAKEDGGVVKQTLSPEFLLQWLEGNKLTYLLDYTYIIPKGVKTLGDLEPSTAPKEGQLSKAFVTPDPDRQSKLESLLSIIGSAASFYGIAQSALGNIKSRFAEAKGVVNNLKETAAGLQDKFNDSKDLLTKDALEGKVDQLKDNAKNQVSNIKSKIPRLKANLKKEVEERKKKLKKKPKDPKAKKKFSLQNFSLPPIPPPPTIPEVPQPPNINDATKSFTGVSPETFKSQATDALEQAKDKTNQAKNVVGTNTSPDTASNITSPQTGTVTSTSTTPPAAEQGVNLQLSKYRDDRSVGYGVGKSQSESLARQMADFNARADLAKKLGKSTISASEFDSKTYLIGGKIYQTEIAMKEN
jgi:hypothetical protein